MKTTINGATFYLKTLPEWHPAGAIAVAPFVLLKKEFHNTPSGQEILWHEAVHIKDQKRWHVIWWLSYLLLLPIGPSLKACWEWRAYKAQLQYIHAMRGITARTKKWAVDSLSGSLYFWCMPRWLARKLVEKECARLDSGGK
jgi:hypothetical protein